MELKKHKIKKNIMAVDLLLGLQWKMKVKGKIVDVLTSNYNIIARFKEDQMLDIH